MITITSTAESLEQAKALLEAGVDRLYIGEKNYGLRVPTALTNEEIQKITELAHDAGKTVTVAVNALMHTEMMAKIKDFLDFLVEIKADRIAVGDAGVIFVLQRDKYELPFTYDASTMVASARQVNFWAKQGAIEAVLARELPKEELADMTDELAVPGEILVYGATVIHHSKRPLVQNYYNFIKTEEKGGVETGQAYRAKLFRKLSLEAKFVFATTFPDRNIQSETSYLGLLDSEVIWMYGFFTNCKISPVIYTLEQLENTFEEKNYTFSRDGDTITYHFSDSGVYYKVFLTEETSDFVHRVMMISNGCLVRKDYYTYCRIYSEYYIPLNGQAQLYLRRFFNEKIL